MKISKKTISILVLSFIVLFLVSAKYDAMTEADLSIAFGHHEIHDGRSYMISRNVTIPVANDDELYFKPPNTKRWSHFTWVVVSDAAVTVSLYETTALTYVAGNILVPLNRNRNSANTSGMAWCHTPAGAGSDGTLIWTDTSGVVGAPVSAQPGSSAERAEIILKQNTAYLMRIAGASGDVMTVNYSWYEHTSIR